MRKSIWIILSIVASIISASIAAPGIATFYSSYTPSACYGNQPQGVWIAAGGRAIWNDGAACGKYYYVKCTGPTNPYPCTNNSPVKVKIVDQCPDCPTIDLSKEAFAQIANPVAGIINIEYYPA